MQSHVGGSFAPPLTNELLASYRETVDALPTSPIKDALSALLNCCGVWWELPDPVGTAMWQHQSGRGTVVKLQADHAATLDPHIPWAHELESFKALFDAISNDTQRDLRNLAFHLLWHVIELDLGREPLTKDKL